MKNTFKFTLPDFPNENFEFENNIFSGKATLKQNGNLVEQSKEKGKPFLIKRINNEIVKAFPKANFPDISAQVLNIDGKKHLMATKLKWYEYIIGGIPLILILSGGMIGGAFGGIAIVLNYTFFRENTSSKNRYIKVIAINLISILHFLFVTGIISSRSYQ